MSAAGDLFAGVPAGRPRRSAAAELNADARFAALFGARRSTGRERAPDAFSAATCVSFQVPNSDAEMWTLHHRSAAGADAEPFLWLAHAGQVRYSAAVADWDGGAYRQLAAIRDVLFPHAGKDQVGWVHSAGGLAVSFAGFARAYAITAHLAPPVEFSEHDLSVAPQRAFGRITELLLSA